MKVHLFFYNDLIDIGSKWATYGIFNYVFEKEVKLKHGANKISLLHAVVGLQVYALYFETERIFINYRLLTMIYTLY